MEVIIVVSDVLPTIVIYLNRKFNIEIEEAIKVVKKSQVLKGCSEDENEISLQEWLGKFLDELIGIPAVACAIPTANGLDVDAVTPV